MSDMTKLERRCLARVKDSPDDIDLIRAVLAEAGVDELVHLVRCYRDDLRYPPRADSIERRLEAIDRALAKVLP